MINKETKHYLFERTNIKNQLIEISIDILRNWIMAICSIGFIKYFDGILTDTFFVFIEYRLISKKGEGTFSEVL